MKIKKAARIDGIIETCRKRIMEKIGRFNEEDMEERCNSEGLEEYSSAPAQKRRLGKGRELPR